jgi:hypothetical protein
MDRTIGHASSNRQRIRKLRGIPLEARRTKRQKANADFLCGPRRTGAAPF